VPALVRLRASRATSYHKRTIALGTYGQDEYLTREEMEIGRHIQAPAGVQRPRTRGECIDGPRPCPWVSCAHNLYLDVNAAGGITLSHPDLDPDEMRESCALDVSDRGGATLDEVAEALGLTRQRAEQMEKVALRKLNTAAEKGRT
jgi:hypothetical protein